MAPLDHVVPLPENVSPDQSACLGILGVMAHFAVHVGATLSGAHVLVQGARGAVGMCAVQLARQAGARLIGTVRSSAEEPAARAAGAHEVVLNDQTLAERMKVLVPEGVDHVVEVAFGANVDVDVNLLKMGGSIGAYASDNATPKIPFWLMVFKNIRPYFLGSEDFPTEAKLAATRDLNDVLRAGWPGFEIGERIPLAEIARAHELAEHPERRGCVVVTV